MQITKRYRCPKCGAEAFNVTAHVTQDWVIDCFGTFVKSIDDCVEVTHYPNDDDIWDCANCEFSAPGSEFIIKKSQAETKAQMKTLLIFHFDTGVTSCLYWDIAVIIDGPFDYAILEDSFSAYFDSDYDADEGYDASVKNVMDDSGLKWEMVSDEFTCNRIVQMYI